MSIRFLPNSRASTDHAPGPSITRLTPSAASKRCMLGVPPRPKIIQTSMIACKAPATGVHNPASSRLPTPIPLLLEGCSGFWGAPHDGFYARFVAIGVGSLLLAGLWTPVAGALQAIIEVWII